MKLKAKFYKDQSFLDKTYYTLLGNKIIDTDNSEIGEVETGVFYDKHKSQPYPVVIESTKTVEVITFIELTGKSDYSFQDSIVRLSDIVRKSKVASGLTDHSVGYGLFSFANSMTDKGKKAILGAEMYVKTDDTDEFEYDHITLLSKNKAGYRTLCRLLTLASSRETTETIKNPKSRPWITLSDIEKVDTSNLIIMTGFSYSKVKKEIKSDNIEEAVSYVEQLKKLIDNSDLYLEVQFHNNEDDSLFDKYRKLSELTNTKLVFTNDFHMPNKGDIEALEVFQTMGMKQLVDGSNWHIEGENWHIHTSEEVEEMELPSDITDNTIEVFNKIESFSLRVKDNYMPKFNIPKGFESEPEYFTYLAKKGLEVRMNGNIPEEYQSRLDEEMKIIKDMGFTGYFLIVSDFINYAKRNYSVADEETSARWKSFIEHNGYSPKPIAMGPARGSVAGSLVAYAMAITEIDPLKYGLLFERFLNPERVSMPDVDADMPDNKRQEIIHYVKDYYNTDSNKVESRVSGIGTFGTFKIKALLKALVRVLWGDTAFGNKLAALSDESNEKGDMSWKQYTELDSVKKMFSSPDTARRMDKLNRYAPKLIGLVSNLTQHAAGYVIAPDSVTNFLPTTFAENSKTGEMEMLTSYTYVEDSGLLKMDFLGLRTMAIIDDAITTVNEERGLSLTVSEILEKAPTDLNLYKFIQKGNTADLFQLASAGMTDVIVRSLADVNDSGNQQKADDSIFFSRIIAGIAMYRPGPMAYINDFVNNALHPETITYPIDEMKSVLETSFGLMIYQESIMSLLRVVAGFSLGGADIARRAISKKKLEVLEEQKKIFIDGDDNTKGGIAMGFSRDALEKLWGDVETFANYGFNKSHAAGYAHVVIIQAWLAYYYPSHFAVSNLNHPQNKDSVAKLLSFYKYRGLETHPASVNTAEDLFTTQNGEIQFGLSGIKKVASKAYSIKEERRENGKFKDLLDFLLRMSRNQDSSLNKSSLEALIYSGSLDEFSGTRLDKLDNIEKLSNSISLFKKVDNTIFDKAEDGFFDTFLDFKGLVMDETDVLNKEKEYTGFFISGHPVINYKNKYSWVSNYDKVGTMKSKLKVAVVITEVKKIITKRGEQMAFLTVEDEDSSTEVVVFPKVYKDCAGSLVENNVITLYGDNDNGKILATVIEEEPEMPLEIIKLVVSLPKSTSRAKGIIKNVSEISDDDTDSDSDGKFVNIGFYPHSESTSAVKTLAKNVYPIRYSVDNVTWLNDIAGSRNIKSLWKVSDSADLYKESKFDLEELIDDIEENYL